ncbi:hypothetical protein F5883DRAFT_679769 [Diaporthe sp. PMI_573]|nr:hypothetical protein F5883DRAFT_679769 [Diaporthaceae sp. PMI_573]
MPEPVYSPSYDLPEPEEAPPSWTWNHFEVRTLVCLIIKGEHKVSKDPMDLTDKLNHALNPASSGGQPAYSRDVPHAEVQAMLKRILSKKLHAVDLSERDYSAPVTRTKLNAFMRNLGFDGSKDEWDRGRKKHVRAETEKRLVRYMIRKEGGRPSPRSREERDRRRMLLREPRARRLLRGWGIGASFWEDEPKGENRPVHGDEDRDPFLLPANPARYSSNTDNAPFLSAGLPPVRNGGFAITPNARDLVAMWAGGFASTAATPRKGAIAPQSMSFMPGPDSTQQAPVLDYGGDGGFGSPNNPQQQPSQWAEGEQNGAWGASGALAGDHLPTGSHHAGRGF